MNTLPAPIKPWYREPWPWFLMTFPAIAVVAGIGTWVIAARTSDGLVVKDYYKQGLTINRVLESRQRAAELGMSGLLRQEGSELRLQLASTRSVELPARLRLSLLDPVRAGMDRVLLLDRKKDEYSATINGIRDGQWNLRLEDEAGLWRMDTAVTLPLSGPQDILP